MNFNTIITSITFDFNVIKLIITAFTIKIIE